MLDAQVVVAKSWSSVCWVLGLEREAVVSTFKELKVQISRSSCSNKKLVLSADSLSMHTHMCASPSL